MPLQIKGKITDTEGLPLYHVAEISEIPLNPGTGVLPVTGANVLSDEQTGDFTFFAMNPSSLIRVFAIGYKVRTFPATAVPAEIALEPATVIEGKTTKKEDNTLLYIGGALLIAGVLLAFANKQKGGKAAPKPDKAVPMLGQPVKVKLFV